MSGSTVRTKKLHVTVSVTYAEEYEIEVPDDGVEWDYNRDDEIMEYICDPDRCGEMLAQRDGHVPMQVVEIREGEP
jgi:hypothetical protein